MNTTENNKIIAEFMGLSYCEKYQFEGWYKNHEHNERVYELLYDTDWNWLMEVVEKIESLDYWVEILGGYYNQCNIGKQNNIKNLIERDSETKIEAVYNACIEFIKWYNEQII